MGLDGEQLNLKRRNLSVQDGIRRMHRKKFSEEEEDLELEEEDENNDKDPMSSEELLRLIEEESKAALQRMRDMKGHEDKEFEAYADSFLDSLKKDFKDGNSKRLIDYIKELDDKEKKEIERKYRKKIEEQTEKRKKKKKKKLRKGPSKEDINKYGPYFNYTPFERAVIASSGKYPFNNEHVEIIANKGYDYNNMGYWSPSTH